MIIDVFFTTQDKDALHTFGLVIQAHQEWRENMLSVCAQHGFESFCGPDFCIPEFFLQDRFAIKSRGRGFNPVNDKSVYAFPDYELYTLRRDYPVGAEIYRQIDEICRDALGAINLTQEKYGRPLHVGYQQAICSLLGISHTYNFSDITAFSQVWRVVGADDNSLLISSVPAALDSSNNQYHIPYVPSIWTPVSSHDVIYAFNVNNDQLTESE